MRRRLIVFSALLLLLVNLFCVTGTYAWFTSAGNVGDGAFDSGLVLYEPGGSFVHTATGIDPETGSEIPTNELVVPGSVLIDAGHPLTLANKSNVSTKLKVEILYEFRLRPGEETDPESPDNGMGASSSYTETMNDLLLFELDPAVWKQTTNGAEIDPADRKRVYYYGQSGNQNPDDQGQVIPPDQLTSPFAVISSMQLNGEYGGFHLNEQLLITVRFYARQSEYIDGWSVIQDYTIGI